ncbi:MAG: phosphoribosyltransferase [Candidatus Harrisonbacteria bacterium CG10_big_fil_rev_8_21_14_0_10_49_15]|uniref:Orotate phosphoribosyltransferase n=1 Tax=Candidatus Harrisonbacteria bacterium CG10_big_fil_rev_8_21_14_0_10_49_15 TaxID=1974587 RepID=A0A2H0UM70_9BACT|nr:MAG: phosphoribosyltransferase [Candidatus Harrisonbacteria bacterium CG10_big_fil_rev_8_21_14_0_10_49_15]
MNPAGEILAGIGAVLSDQHFVYKAGGHGPGYVAKDVAYTWPGSYALLADDMAALAAESGIEVVCGIEAGAIALGQLVAQAMLRNNPAIRAVFAEKERVAIPDPLGQGRKAFVETGKTVLSRGYGDIVRGRRVLVVEDITTTGSTAKEVVDAIRDAGGIVVCVALICNRGNVSAEAVGVPSLLSLIEVNMANYSADDCPLCLRGVPINTQFGHGRAYVEQYGQPKQA